MESLRITPQFRDLLVQQMSEHRDRMKDEHQKNKSGNLAGSIGWIEWDRKLRLKIGETEMSISILRDLE